MNSKWYFWALAALIVLSQGLCIGLLPREDFSWAFPAMEALTISIFILLLVFYNRIVKPLRIIANGMDLLKEQDFSSRLGYVGQQDADRIVDIFNRMMLQLKNERLHIREQNRFLDLLVQSSPVGIMILNPEGKILSLNPAAVKIFGLHGDGQARGRKLQELDFPLFRELSGMKRGESLTVRMPDASVYKCTCATFVESGFPHLFYLIESMTEEVLRAEKKAYGKVIRMIAHEVNNSMAGVTSTLNMLSEMLEKEPEMGALLTGLSERCYGLSRFITDFAEVVKIPEPRPEKVLLNDFILAELRFLESLCAGKNINIRTELACGRTYVNIDTTLWEQVLVNIVKNALEAIGESGEIIVATAKEEVSGGGVLLEISNTGAPISDRAQARLFTPFFSTRPGGQGIGLMIIRDILQKHRCRFSLRTYPDGLTRFRIRLEKA